MSAKLEFFRVELSPGKWFVDSTGTESFMRDGERLLALRGIRETENKEEAAVFTARTARALYILATVTHPGAGLHPATFADWIEQESKAVSAPAAVQNLKTP